MAKTDTDTKTPVPVLVINSVEDIATYVGELDTANVEGPGVRHWTNKRGFKTNSALLTAPSAVLAGMVGACVSALSAQVADGDEGAQEHLDLAREFSANVDTITAALSDIRSLASAALAMGTTIEGVKKGSAVGDLTPSQQAQLASAFIADTGKAVSSDLQSAIEQLTA